MPDSYNIKGTLTFEEYLECHKILAAKRRFWIRVIITIYGVEMTFLTTAFGHQDKISRAFIDGSLIAN